jgi:hypothetical protein
MKDSIQSWRSKWFYLRDQPASGHCSGLPKFMDVLEAKVMVMKNVGGQIMIGNDIAALFLKRRIQPVVSRTHQMWLYTGAKDVIRINAMELSEKELLDEVRRLTYLVNNTPSPWWTFKTHTSFIIFRPR